MFFWRKKKAREMAEKERLIQHYQKDSLEKIEVASKATKKTTERMQKMGLDGVTEAFLAATGRKNK
jgi:putative heme iron utilization protein